MAAGNLLLAASILYTGNTYTRVCELMATAKINFFSHTLFHRIQSQFLFPAVASIFSTYQQSIVAKRLLANPLNIIGDGRYDSPGYNTKYCTYTVMDASTQEIIDFNGCSHRKIFFPTRSEVCEMVRSMPRDSQKYARWSEVCCKYYN